MNYRDVAQRDFLAKRYLSFLFFDAVKHNASGGQAALMGNRDKQSPRTLRIDDV